MISPERLRYFSFFGSLDDAQIKAIAMIAEEETHRAGDLLFLKGRPAEALYLLAEGCVDLYYYVNGEPSPEFADGIPVGEITPGEPFSISALIEPYVLTATARVCKPSKVIRIDSGALRGLFAEDRRMAYLLTEKAAKAVIQRLHAARIQLVSLM